MEGADVSVSAHEFPKVGTLWVQCTCPIDKISEVHTKPNMLDRMRYNATGGNSILIRFGDFAKIGKFSNFGMSELENFPILTCQNWKIFQFWRVRIGKFSNFGVCQNWKIFQF